MLPTTIIAVSSAVFNLAGPREGRSDFVTTTAVGNILRGDKMSLGDRLRDIYLGGPGAKLKSFYRWAQNPDNYEYIGMPVTTYFGVQSFTTGGAYNSSLPPEHPSQPWRMALLEYRFGSAAYDLSPRPYVTKIVVGRGNYTWWADKWVLDNHQTDYGQPWTSDFNETTEQITISLPGHWSATIDPDSFGSSNGYSTYDKNATYIYAVYRNFRSQDNQVIIYKMGNGMALLDSLAVEVSGTDYGYFPHIPIRSRNEFLSESYNPLIYAQAKKGFKKALGQKMSKIEDKLADNENLDDLDYIYALFGVALNTKEPASMKYVYNYFNMLMGVQVGNSTQYDAYKAEMLVYKAQADAWLAWKNGGMVGSEPIIDSTPVSPISGINIQSAASANAEFNFSIMWKYIGEEFGSGLKKPDAKVGELWWDEDTSIDADHIMSGTDYKLKARKVEADTYRLNWQVTADSWKTMVIVGAVHKNSVYKGRSVNISMREAFDDTEESGFLLPLHKPTMDAMGMVNTTRLSMTSCYIVVNCYEEIKTSILGIIFFIAAIVIMVVYPPAGGLLGANAAVGLSLGVSVASAAFVGAVVNMLAAMIVMNLIQKAAVLILGEKIGNIIGTIVSFLVISIGTGLQNGQNLASIFGSMLQPDKLLMLTTAVGNGVSGYVQASIKDVYGQIEDLQNQYKEDSRHLQELYANNIGYGMGTINPMELTSVFGAYLETSQQFLSRTLMTGTDIAELSKDMLSNFCEITTSIDLPLAN